MATNFVFRGPARYSALLLVLVGSGWSASVLAQDDQGGVFIEEIIVTSAKREQTLQEVPIAVSVTNADTIEKSQILDINDLQTVVPSLRVTQLQSCRPPIRIF